MTGTWVHNTALSWLMYRLTHSEVMLGLTSLFTNLPMLLFGLVGGLAADRFPRRRILLTTQSIFLVQAALFAVLTYTGWIEVWHVYALGLLFGLANAFDVPARQSMILEITSKEDLVSAVSVNSMMFNLARIAGPAAGGLAIAAVGEAACFGLNAISFFAVLVGLLLMRLKPREAPVVAHTGWGEGYEYLRSNPVIWRLLLVSGCMNIGFSGTVVLNPFFAQDLFGKGATGLGMLTTSIGVGAIIGIYFLASSGDQRRLPRVSVVSGLSLGVALMAYGLSPSYWWSLLAMAIAGGSLIRQNGATNSTLQITVPEHLRGRIVSLFGISVVGMAPVGATAFSALARATNIRVAAVTAGAWCLACAWALGRGLKRHGALLLFCLPMLSADALLLRKVDQFLKETSTLTGFEVKRKVPAAMMTKVELERYLKSKMKEEVAPEKIRLEELVLKMFGFAPEDFRLEETTVNLLQEQAAAFYDFKERKLFVLDHVQDDLGPELLIHELGHALADQQYGLSRFLKGARDDDDAALARMAVMEGQAMWLMGEHSARLQGTTLKGSPELVRRLSMMDGGDDAQFPVMQKVPLYLKESLLFPYSHGFRFQAAVCEKDDKCMSRVFEQPPVSSSQVMHPELYFAGVKPEKVVAPEAKNPYKLRTDGTLGELDIDILMRTFHVEREGLAEKFRGGSYRLYEHKKTRDPLLTHASVWKDEAAAKDWFSAYVALLASKWKKCEISRREPALIEGKGDRGPFRMRLDGARVLVEEGLPVH